MENILDIGTNNVELTTEGVFDFLNTKLQTTPDDLTWLVFFGDKEFIQSGLHYLTEKDNHIAVHADDINEVIMMNDKYLKSNNSKIIIIDKNYSGKLQGADADEWATYMNKAAISEVKNGLDNLFSWFYQCVDDGLETYKDDKPVVSLLKELKGSFEKVYTKLTKNTKIVKGKITIENAGCVKHTELILHNLKYNNDDTVVDKLTEELALTEEQSKMLTTENALEYIRNITDNVKYLKK